MGQPVTVVESRTAIPGVVRFELNRSISGMDHEVYLADTTVTGDRPVDECARRLLAHGGVDRVSINSSVVTVELSKGSDGTGLKEVLENLFRFYPDDDHDDASQPAPAGADG